MSFYEWIGMVVCAWVHHLVVSPIEMHQNRILQNRRFDLPAEQSIHLLIILYGIGWYMRTHNEKKIKLPYDVCLCFVASV